ncbi:MAG: DUF5107 domain-containing protein [Clostridia bacterium]|nr:DUF5107 domain-containing protein [Clostridia bacterium]
MTTLSFEPYEIMSASLGEENPMPDLKNVSYIHATYKLSDKLDEDDRKHIGKGMVKTILPYLNEDGYDRDLKLKKFKAAILENEKLRAVFLPEIGGRLWSLYHKEEKRELLFVNKVFQPGNLGIRNAWFSGGVEWNVGIKGHNPLTCDPLFAAESKNEEGESILTMYEYERLRGIVYSINAYLPEGSDKLYIKTSVENTSDKEKYMYWWSNIAVEEKGMRVLAPADEMFLCKYNDNHYFIDKCPAPDYEGEDLSYAERGKRSIDFFYKVPTESKKWVAAVDKDGKGLLQMSTPELKGRKVFLWGQGKGGRNWNKFLQRDDSTYIEIQAGLLYTQMEHIPMPPKTVWEWTEMYTLADISPDAAQSDWQTANKAMAEYVDSIYDFDEVNIPVNTKKEIKMYGSGWGAFENKLNKVSNICEFPEDSMNEKQAEWNFLLDNGYLKENDGVNPPVSYVTDSEILELLEKSLEKEEGNHWYTHYHIGIIRYKLADFEGALKAWQKSAELKETAWNLRNIAMIYKNEIKDVSLATQYMGKAINVGGIEVRGLVNDAGGLYTTCGAPEKWLELYNTLSDEFKNLGRFKLYCAVAYLAMNQKQKAKEFINEDFELHDIKEGELSVSALWSEIYGDEVPLPERLDFRMHE